jgi:transposase InsO family protein
MNSNQREIQRKLRVLEHADKIGDVSKTCRYFGIGRASFYRWRKAYADKGDAGLLVARSVPHNLPNKMSPEVEEKILHLRRTYHLGPIRIVWYLERYHAIKVSDAGVYRTLKHHGLNRLPRGTRLRKVHTQRYNKQVPGHHIQMDVKFLIFKGKQGQKVKRYQYTAIDDATRVRALKVYKRHT